MTAIHKIDRYTRKTSNIKKKILYIYVIQCSVRLPTLALICSSHMPNLKHTVCGLYRDSRKTSFVNETHFSMSPPPCICPSYFLHDQKFHSVLKSRSLWPYSSQDLTAPRKRELSSNSSPYIVLPNQISTSFWLVLQEINYEVRTNILYTCRKCQALQLQAISGVITNSINRGTERSLFNCQWQRLQRSLRVMNTEILVAGN